MNLSVSQVMNQADMAEKETAFESAAGVAVVALRSDGNLVFAVAETGDYMTQAVFYKRFRYDRFTPLASIPEITDVTADIEDDSISEKPDDLMTWAEDENTPIEDVKAHLASMGVEVKNWNRSQLVAQVKKAAEKE